MDRAGAYAIQGLASRFITRIEGSYSNVVGLPVAMVSSILNRG
jgi:septum formation protein